MTRELRNLVLRLRQNNVKYRFEIHYKSTPLRIVVRQRVSGKAVWTGCHENGQILGAVATHVVTWQTRHNLQSETDPSIGSLCSLAAKAKWYEEDPHILKPEVRRRAEDLFARMEAEWKEQHEQQPPALMNGPEEP